MGGSFMPLLPNSADVLLAIRAIILHQLCGESVSRKGKP
jgi:hypothetical protein